MRRRSCGIAPRVRSINTLSANRFEADPNLPAWNRQVSPASQLPL